MQSNRAFIASHPTQIQFKTLKYSGNYTVETTCLTTEISPLCTYSSFTCFYAILRVVLYGCKFWALTLRDEQRPYVFENSVLKKKDTWVKEGRSRSKGELENTAQR